MKEAYLTASEIYEIDNLTQLNFVEYLEEISPEKRDLVLHIFAKNRGLNVLRIILDEAQEGTKRLIRILEEHGIQHVGLP